MDTLLTIYLSGLGLLAFTFVILAVAANYLADDCTLRDMTARYLLLTPLWFIILPVMLLRVLAKVVYWGIKQPSIEKPEPRGDAADEGMA